MTDMIDTNTQIPDSIDWHESGIIVKAITIVGTASTAFIVSLLEVFGIDVANPQKAKIGAAVAAFLALVAAVGIVYNRLHQKYCPTINPGILPKKSTLTDGDAK